MEAHSWAAGAARLAGGLSLSAAALHELLDCVGLCCAVWDRAGMGWVSPPPRKWGGKGFDERAGTWFCALPCHGFAEGLTLCSVLQSPTCYRGFIGDL